MEPLRCVKCGAQDGACPSCGQAKPKLAEIDVFGKKVVLCPAHLAEWEKLNAEKRKSWQPELADSYFAEVSKKKGGVA